jgi:hypothetical protein
MDQLVESAQFVTDYEDKERGFNPLLWGTYQFHRARRFALNHMYGE